MRVTIRTHEGEGRWDDAAVELPDGYDGEPCGDQAPFAVASNQEIIPHDESFPGEREIEISLEFLEEPEEDAEAAGRYAVRIMSSGDDSVDAGRAKDVFHRSVAIGCLDEAVMRVLDGERELLEAFDYEPGSYSGKPAMCWRKEQP
jgi:hypothetical protein